MPCVGDWVSVQERRREGCRGWGVTSEAFSHGGWPRGQEMQCREGSPAPFCPLQRTRHARMHSAGEFATASSGLEALGTLCHHGDSWARLSV